MLTPQYLTELKKDLHNNTSITAKRVAVLLAAYEDVINGTTTTEPIDPATHAPIAKETAPEPNRVKKAAAAAKKAKKKATEK